MIPIGFKALKTFAALKPCAFAILAKISVGQFADTLDTIFVIQKVVRRVGKRRSGMPVFVVIWSLTKNEISAEKHLY